MKLITKSNSMTLSIILTLLKKKIIQLLRKIKKEKL